MVRIDGAGSLVGDSYHALSAYWDDGSYTTSTVTAELYTGANFSSTVATKTGADFGGDLLADVIWASDLVHHDSNGKVGDGAFVLYNQTANALYVWDTGSNTIYSKAITSGYGCMGAFYKEGYLYWMETELVAHANVDSSNNAPFYFVLHKAYCDLTGETTYSNSIDLYTEQPMGHVGTLMFCLGAFLFSDHFGVQVKIVGQDMPVYNQVYMDLTGGSPLSVAYPGGGSGPIYGFGTYFSSGDAFTANPLALEGVTNTINEITNGFSTVTGFSIATVSWTATIVTAGVNSSRDKFYSYSCPTMPPGANGVLESSSVPLGSPASLTINPRSTFDDGGTPFWTPMFMFIHA